MKDSTKAVVAGSHSVPKTSLGDRPDNQKWKSFCKGVREPS